MNPFERGLQRIRYLRTPEGSNKLGIGTAEKTLLTLATLLVIGGIHRVLTIAEGGMGIEYLKDQSRDGATYTVRPGDNLFRIGLNLGADPECLARVNGIENPRLIHPGQELKNPPECQTSNK